MPLHRRTERKREAILVAGRRVFLRSGYRGSSMDAIAAEAKVSKRTLYAHFESKESLFVAIVRDACERVVAPITRGRPHDDVETTLRALGRQFVGVALSPWLNALHRLVVAESVRFPELGRLYYGVAREKLWDVIARYLEEQAGRGVLRIDKPELAAEQFCAILAGHPHVRLQLGVDRRRPPHALAEDVDYGVRLFLGGCRADGSDVRPAAHRQAS
jgi:TetR/AcrR family transcriptional regulator, mexJK operon transcriptional repressor